MAATAVQTEQFDALLKKLVDDWKRIKPVVSSWFVTSDNLLIKGFRFLIDGISQAVDLAETFTVPGADKKALVLALANQLFEAVIVPALPAILKPFKGTIKTIFNALLDSLIEYVVTKLPDTPAVA